MSSAVGSFQLNAAGELSLSLFGKNPTLSNNNQTNKLASDIEH